MLFNTFSILIFIHDKVNELIKSLRQLHYVIIKVYSIMRFPEVYVLQSYCFERKKLKDINVLSVLGLSPLFVNIMLVLKTESNYM